MNRSAALPMLCLAVLLASGCSRSSSSIANSHSINTSTPQETAKSYVREFEWRLPEPEYAYLIDLQDRMLFLKAHRDEMVKTLEAVDFADDGNIGVAFMRYTVGSKVYRESIWMRKMDAKWTASSRQYYSTISDDPFGDGKPADAKKLISRADEWEKDAKEWW